MNTSDTSSFSKMLRLMILERMNGDFLKALLENPELLVDDKITRAIFSIGYARGVEFGLDVAEKKEKGLI